MASGGRNSQSTDAPYHPPLSSMRTISHCAVIAFMLLAVSQTKQGKQTN